jgi:hypothetical protein
VTTPSILGGPVSVALEADLRTWVRRHGVVVWLDLDQHYTGFVDRLIAARAADALSYEVRAWRGSHLELMLALDGVAAGSERTGLVVHLPGFTEEDVRQSPLFELYAAGARYRKALGTLIGEAAGGHVRPEQIAALRAQAGLTLEGADAWLQSQVDQVTGGFAAQLRTLSPVALLDDLLSGGFVAGRVAQRDNQTVLWERLLTVLGLPPGWREATLPGDQARPEDMAYVMASWALAVEYVHDLKRAPVSPLLQAAVGMLPTLVDACRSIAVHLRDRHAGFYQRSADETEALLLDEIEAARAEDLGRIDTFRFEEDKVLKAALAGLQERNWQPVSEWAATRVRAERGQGSFWLRDDPARLSAWQLVQGAAQLGLTLTHAGPRIGAASGLEEALQAYTERGAAADQAHRHLEQRRLSLLYPQLPEFEALRTALDGARLAWRAWADAWAREFNALCRAHGFLPGAAQQQRTLFDDVVRPMAQEAGSTAFFMVDALRFEMAEELYRQLSDTPASTVQLKARYAELPTVTEVGMNVLAPVAQGGRLSPAMSYTSDGRASVAGFASGEFRVSDPETRKRAMQDRVGGSTCPWLSLEEVVSRDSASLKRAVAKARLVIVHSREIDNAGEKGVGPAVFDHVLQKLRAAWRLLRDAGVRRFVITSDHGFLLLDDGVANALTHGRKIDPHRRHVFSPVAADHAGEARVALADLGYDGASGHLMFPDSTAVFDLGRRPMSFVHGGNSLQERVIPVLTLVHRAAAGGSTLQYGIRAEACDGVAGMHCLELQVDVAAQGALDFGGASEVELGLRVPEAPTVQVELCQARGRARIQGSTMLATVGERVELFFRLSGAVDARVQVEIHHPGAVADVQPCIPEARFAVDTTRAPLPSSADRPAAVVRLERAWLAEYTDAGVRQLFEHLAVHGVVTEGEASEMLGGPRGLRRFATQFEEQARKAPFAVRIDVIAGVKRFVRHGGGE